MDEIPSRSSCCEESAASCEPGAAVAETQLETAEAGRLAASLKVLSDPIRLRLLSLIAAAPGHEVCACDLVEPLDRSQPTISHHLKALREAGFLTAERRGTWIWYAARFERVAEVRESLALLLEPTSDALAR